jgi:hypothetical protein
MNILDPGAITFEKSPSGYLNAKHNGDDLYQNIRCVPLFPLSDQDRFISVLRKKEKEYVEIGIIKDLGSFPAGQQALIKEDVAYRYFVPEILDVVKVVNKNGMDLFTVKTDRGDKTISVRDKKESVIQSDNGIIFVTDIDKCRYKITDTRKLREKAREMVERMLM